MISPAIQASQARGITFALLKELAFLHNPRYGYAWPSIDHLADRLHISARTVQRHLRKLESLGEIVVERVRGRGLNNRYFIRGLEKVTTWRNIHHTKEKKPFAGTMPRAPAPPKTFSLFPESTTEQLLSKWLTRGSRLWQTITGTTPPLSSPASSP
jgi:DNA-binding transcriptional regulator YhcF (GntR family)